VSRGNPVYTRFVEREDAVRTYLNAVVAVGAAVALTAVAAGCARGGDDRAGGKPEPTALTLTMANGLYRPHELQSFADEVARLSGGKMRIEFRNRWLGWPWRRPESAVIRDVAAGKADLGSVGSRAWDDVGISGFNALHAPLLVDSYVLQAEVLESRIPGEMLEALEPLRLVGLGILPSPLRKLLGVERPLTQPENFRGQRIGITESRVARDTLHALGATAIAVPAGSQIGGLDGVEQQVEAIESNTYDAGAKYLTTNINLWPRPLVLFMNKAAFTALEPVQRDVLRGALGNVLPETLTAIRAREQTAAAVLCRRGLSFVVATPADMSKLRDALAPVYRELEQDNQTRSVVARIRQLRQTTSDSAETLPSCATGESSSSAAIPNGVYTNTTTAADARRAQIRAGDPFYRDLPMRHRLVLESNDFVLHVTFPDGRSEIGLSGTYSVYRDRIVFQGSEDKLTFGWSFDGKILRLDGEGTGGYYGAGFTPPWTKVG
jgi:TRAP-type C4-dicarboxylate transport system substrate-binding protein